VGGTYASYFEDIGSISQCGGMGSMPGHCKRFVVDKVALGQVFFQALWLSPVYIIPQMLHSQLSLMLYILSNKQHC